jgi:hypothetical protein
LQWPSTGAPLKRILVEGPGVDTAGEDGVFTDPTDEFARIYGLTQDTVLLIRPDGYIGHIAMHDMAKTTHAAIEAITPRP